MDDDYARLSLLCGFFASAADHALGRYHFAPKVRDEAWSLTPEKLAAWKQEAIALGVPADALEPTDEEKARIPALIETGKRMQADLDLKIYGRTKH